MCSLWWLSRHLLICLFMWLEWYCYGLKMDGCNILDRWLQFGCFLLLFLSFRFCCLISLVFIFISFIKDWRLTSLLCYNESKRRKEKYRKNSKNKCKKQSINKPQLSIKYEPKTVNEVYLNQKSNQHLIRKRLLSTVNN